MLKLIEYLFSVLAINLISKLCKPPASDAEVKANIIVVTFMVNFLSVNFYYQGYASLNRVIPIGYPKRKYIWVVVAFGYKDSGDQ